MPSLYWYAIVTRGVKRYLKETGFGLQTTGEVTLIIRLVFFIVAILIVINAFQPSLGTLLSLTVILGTAIGLAFSQALSNVVR